MEAKDEDFLMYLETPFFITCSKRLHHLKFYEDVDGNIEIRIHKAIAKWNKYTLNRIQNNNLEKPSFIIDGQTISIGEERHLCVLLMKALESVNIKH